MRNFFLFLIGLAFSLTPILATSFSTKTDSAEYWWCSNCGLAYPLSQKFCLNKDCPLFRKSK